MNWSGRGGIASQGSRKRMRFNAVRELLQRAEGDRLMRPGLLLEIDRSGLQGVGADPESRSKAEATGSYLFPPL